MSKQKFKGFNKEITNYKEPVYEVMLPVINSTIRTKAITLREENSLAKSLISEENIFAYTIKFLYHHICYGNEVLTSSYESFLNNITENDINTLFYALYVISYGNYISSFMENCICKKEKCSHKHEPKKIDLVECYNDTFYAGKEFDCFKNEIEIDLSEHGLPNVFWYLKMPSIKRIFNLQNEIKKSEEKYTNEIEKIEYQIEKLKAENEVTNQNQINLLNSQIKKLEEDLMENTLDNSVSIITRFTSKFIINNIIKQESKDEDGNPIIKEIKNEKVFDNEVDIINATGELKKITTDVLIKKCDELTKYGSKFIYKWECEKCKTNNEVEFDIQQYFFRTISESR